MRRLNKIDPLTGALRAIAWDFPRPMEDRDLDGYWLAYRDAMVTWVEAFDIPNIFPVHVAVSPERRGRVPLIQCMDEWEYHAREYSGEHEGAFVVAPDAENITPYLGRLGFTQDPESGVWARSFRGNDHG